MTETFDTTPLPSMRTHGSHRDPEPAFSPTMQEELKATWRPSGPTIGSMIVLTAAATHRSVSVSTATKPSSPTWLAGDALRHLKQFHVRRPGDDLGPSHAISEAYLCVNGMACGVRSTCWLRPTSLSPEHATLRSARHLRMAAVRADEDAAVHAGRGVAHDLHHERMSADTAHRIGLVSEVCAGEQLLERPLVADAIAHSRRWGSASLAIWAANDLGTTGVVDGPSLLTTV